MKFLPANQHRSQPWKNGLGVSTVIAEAPAAAGFDAVLWQVTVTEISGDCPFSHMPGLDRTFTVIEGAGVELTAADVPARQIVRPMQPYAFSGDWRTTCRLLDGPVRVLNAIARRGRFVATVEIGTSRTLAPGEVAVAIDLRSLDAWLLDGDGVVPTPEATVVRIAPAAQ